MSISTTIMIIIGLIALKLLGFIAKGILRTVLTFIVCIFIVSQVLILRDLFSIVTDFIGRIMQSIFGNLL